MIRLSHMSPSELVHDKKINLIRGIIIIEELHTNRVTPEETVELMLADGYRCYIQLDSRNRKCVYVSDYPTTDPNAPCKFHTY